MLVINIVDDPAAEINLIFRLDFFVLSGQQLGGRTLRDGVDKLIRLI